MSLADHIRGQEKCRQELEQSLNDLGKEFAAQIRDLGLNVIPVMDPTGALMDFEKSRKQGYRSDLKPTGAVAFPLFVRFPIAPFHDFFCIAITPDGKMLLTEKAVHCQSLGGWPGINAEFDITEYVLIYSLAMGENESWKEKRAKAQLEMLITFSEAAYRNDLRDILEPIELAMLDVYNSARRRR